MSRQLPRPYDMTASIAEYTICLQHELSRASISEFYHYHGGGWYDRRLAWLSTYMEAVGVQPKDVVTEMKSRWKPRILGSVPQLKTSTEEVAMEGIAAAFLEAITGFRRDTGSSDKG
jgi:hypothetical protein